MDAFLNVFIPVAVVVGVPTFAYFFCKGLDKTFAPFRKE